MKEVQSVIYTLRCLGVKPKYASLVCGDNRVVFKHSNILDSILKINMLLFNITGQEKAVTAAISRPIKISGEITLPIF